MLVVNALSLAAVAEQIVGRERRERVSQLDSSGDALIEFAPPRQLRR
jgi:hypothetical protein